MDLCVKESICWYRGSVFPFWLLESDRNIFTLMSFVEMHSFRTPWEGFSAEWRVYDVEGYASCLPASVGVLPQKWILMVPSCPMLRTVFSWDFRCHWGHQWDIHEETMWCPIVMVDSVDFSLDSPTSGCKYSWFSLNAAFLADIRVLQPLGYYAWYNKEIPHGSPEMHYFTRKHRQWEVCQSLLALKDHRILMKSQVENTGIQA